MNHPVLSVAHVEAVKVRAAAGDAMWVDVLDHLLATGEKALEQAPLSVRDNGGSPHFRVDVAYVSGKDGVFNTEANRDCRVMAAQLSRACVDLALCWRFTGDCRYAEKALELIHVWCINENTSMFAAGRVEDAWTPGGVYGGDVVMFTTLQGLLLACSLLESYPGWKLHAHAAVRKWIRGMVEPSRRTMFYQGAEMYNNWDDARISYLVYGALALDDLDLLIEVIDRWGRTLAMKMTDEGQLPRETMRTRSMHYTLKALAHTMDVAYVGWRAGIDLFDLNVNGKSIRKAVDYAARHLVNMESWPFEMISPIDEKTLPSMGLFEIAYRRWGDPMYLDVLDTWGGRPTPHSHATLLYAAPGADAS